MSRFETNDPHGLTGDQSPPSVIVRMKIREIFKASNGTPTGVVRCRSYNGSVESKRDFFVFTNTPYQVGNEIYAARPSGGTARIHAAKPVEWIDVTGASVGSGKRWDVYTTIDDAGTTAWTRPRFAIDLVTPIGT